MFNHFPQINEQVPHGKLCNARSSLPWSKFHQSICAMYKFTGEKYKAQNIIFCFKKNFVHIWLDRFLIQFGKMLMTKKTSKMFNCCALLWLQKRWWNWHCGLISPICQWIGINCAKCAAFVSHSPNLCAEKSISWVSKSLAQMLMKSTPGSFLTHSTFPFSTFYILQHLTLLSTFSPVPFEFTRMQKTYETNFKRNVLWMNLKWDDWASYISKQFIQRSISSTC